MNTVFGKDTSTPFVAYGDDSAYEEVLLYAFVVCHREKIRKLERDILNLKKEFGIPQEIPIHMSKLFSKQYRDKNGITNLDRIRQPIFLRNVINVINRNKCLVRYCYTVVPDNGLVIDESSDGGPIQPVSDNKAIMHQMASACFCPHIENGKIVLSPEDFEVYISADSTKVKFERNSPRRQAHYLSELLIPTANPAHRDKYVRLKLNIQMMKDNIFLQLSDAVAYILAHGLSRKCKEDRYAYQKIELFSTYDMFWLQRITRKIWELSCRSNRVASKIGSTLI